MRKTFSSSKNKNLPYQFIEPLHNDSKEKYPLLIFLHGCKEFGCDNLRQMVKFPKILLSEEYRVKKPCYIIAPQCPENDTWVSFPNYPNDNIVSEEQTPTTLATLELIEHSIATYNIDPEQIVGIGFSLGAEGLFDIVTKNKNVFSAIISIDGMADINKIEDIAQTPSWIFHGAHSPFVDTQEVRNLATLINNSGNNCTYTEFSDLDHQCWTEAYKTEDIWEWLFSKKLSDRTHDQSEVSVSL